MRTKLLLALAAPLALLVAPGAAQARYLKDRDVNKLGVALGDYIEASTAKKGIMLAEAKVREEMDKLSKRLKDAPEPDILACPADLGAALWLANGYAKKRVKKGKVEDYEYTEREFSEENPLRYAVSTPSKYAVKQESPYPVILVIPDEGVDPKQHIIERWQENILKDNAIIAAPKMPGSAGEWTQRDGIASVMLLLRTITDQYSVDYDRIYLAGRGAGVAAALSIAEMFPDRFAGVIGRAGDAGETLPSNFSNLPTYFAGGGAQASKFQEGVDAAGYGNCTLDADGLEADIWNWIQSNPRKSVPEQVVLHPGAPFPTRAYWLAVPPGAEANAKVTAKVDRDTNTITVDGEGVASVTLFYNDALVDMSKPITVIANGKEYKDQIPRSFKTCLNLIYKGTNDPGRVFVATKPYHLTPKSSDESK
jgi:hypothetical protein